MPKGCCVPSCASTERKSGSFISFHEVPSDDRARDAWVDAIAGDDLEERVRLLSNARSVVCSLHFKTTDFKVGMKRRVLKPTAVPSIFPEPGTHLPQPERKRRRRNKEPYYYYHVDSVKQVEEVEEEEETAVAAVSARVEDRPRVVTAETTTIMILPGMVIRHER